MTNDIPATGERRRLSLIARGLPMMAAATLLPFVAAAPAHALTNVICVGNPTGTCSEHAASISAAIAKADANLVDDTILVGPGTYDDGPYSLSSDMTLKGSGQGATFVTLPASPISHDYVVASGATVQNLTIKLAAVSSSNDAGLVLSNDATANRVKVDGTGTENADGMEATDATITSSTILMPGVADGTGVYTGGGAVVTDTTIVARRGVVHSGTGTPDNLSRLTIRASGSGVWTDAGSVNVDDTVIDLGTSAGIGLNASNFNASTTPRSINANHVTIVGGGEDSTGVYAFAGNANALQVSTIQLHNSIVRGPEYPLSVWATNNGAQGGNSVATITTLYSNWASKSESAMPHGTAQVLVGAGNVNLKPGFVNAAAGNYRLSRSSNMVDRGNPDAFGPTWDLAGHDRTEDGDGNGSPVRDMGAYELEADTVAPHTRFTSTPAKVVTSSSVKFRFKSSESGSTYQCKLDKRAWRSCTSPKQLRVALGQHVFKVRATDKVGNADRTPASYRFVRVRP